MPAQSKAAEIEPLIVSPDAAMRMLDCSRSYFYGTLLAQGLLETFTEGRARKVTVAGIRALVKRRLEAAKHSAA